MSLLCSPFIVSRCVKQSTKPARVISNFRSLIPGIFVRPRALLLGKTEPGRESRCLASAILVGGEILPPALV